METGGEFLEEVTRINTEEELSAYREKLHGEILSRNPGREFSVLFGKQKGKLSTVVVRTDGLEELV